MWLVKRLFHDKRCTVALLLLWMITVCTIFYALGAFHMGYMHIGIDSAFLSSHSISKNVNLSVRTRRRHCFHGPED